VWWFITDIITHVKFLVNRNWGFGVLTPPSKFCYLRRIGWLILQHCKHCRATLWSEKEVYMLTPMDRATLLHAKTTISLCSPSTITKKRTSVDSKLLPRPRNVGYWHKFNDSAQTPLSRFVVDVLYNKVCNKYTDKSSWWSLGLKPCIAWPSQGAINSSPSSTTLLISINGVLWRFY